MHRTYIPFAVALVALLWPRPATAQSDDHHVQLGVQVAGARSSEFDATDIGIGGRLSWHPSALLSAEAELGFFPDAFADAPAFSSSRVEGLFGITIGPRIGALRLFAKLRPGFMTYREAPEPFACILIFPPPLACTLASGKTVLAFDVGGGVEAFPTRRTFIRVDAGDRALRYPAPVLDSNGSSRQSAFFIHELRFAIGGGVRF